MLGVVCGVVRAAKAHTKYNSNHITTQQLLFAHAVIAADHRRDAMMQCNDALQA
jgi:hypothetical protein